jgi:short-subunit dehydrogenase
LRFLTLGASAGLGRALAEQLAREGHDLILVASDERDLRALAGHLRLLHSVDVRFIATDLAHPKQATVDVLRLVTDLRVDGILLVAGYAREDDQGTLGGDHLSRVIDLNLTTVQAVVAALLPRLLTQGSGSIVGFGSIAAVRGRRRNVAYASAKRGLRSYFESLMLLVRDTGVEAQFYELGYVATQQAFGRRLFPPPADPARIARQITSGLGSGSRIVYLPRYWALAAWALRLMPLGLFDKVSSGD